MKPGTYVIDVENNTYCLSDGSICFIKSVAGQGHAPVNRLKERGPLQHGSTDVGFRLQERVINIVAIVDGDCVADMYEKRRLLLNIFQARDTPIKLKFVVDSVTAYQIDCYYTGGLQFDWDQIYRNDGGRHYHLVNLQLYCDNPLWYNPTQRIVTFGLAGGGSAFLIPWEIPWFIGASELEQSITVDYEGTFETFPIVTIYGPCTDPVLTNDSTGDKLDFTGTTIAEDDYYVIDCRDAYKTVVDSAGDRKEGDLTSDSDIETFSLKPAPIIAGGSNSFTFVASDVTTDTEVIMRYYDMHVAF